MSAVYRLLNKFSERLNRLALRIRPYMPFTSLNTVWRSLDKNGGSILDVGCGQGQTMEFINRHKDFFTIGVDSYPPSLKECQQHGSHSGYVLCDARMLPFRPKSFDIVLCLEVLEHQKKVEGWKLIKVMDEIARRQVIISTPIDSKIVPARGYKRRSPNENPYWGHKSFWYPAELQVLGYRARVHGAQCLLPWRELVSRIPRCFTPLSYILWVCAGPLAHFFPKLAGGMVCTKSLG